MKNAPSLFIASALLAASLAGCNLVDGGSDSDFEADYTSSDSTTYIRSSATGDILTTPDGRTVYIYDKDTSGVSNCYNECAEKWPRLLQRATPNQSET